MEVALVALRLVQFAAAMVLFGAPALALALPLPVPASSPLRRDFDRWLRRTLIAAAAAALVSGALWLDLEAAIMSDDWSGGLDPGTIGAVAGATLFGRAWLWHLGFGVALFALVLPAARSRALLVPTVLLAAAFLASLAWAGHAVMVPGPTHVLVQSVHLLAGGLWLGSLPALFHLLGLARRDRSGEMRDTLRRLLPLYSRVGYAAVALVLLTGSLNSLFLVGSLHALVTTTYGRVLLVKLGLVLTMVGIAAVNRFFLLAASQTGALWRSVALEQGVAVLVLAAVSVLGTLPPALRS